MNGVCNLFYERKKKYFWSRKLEGTRDQRTEMPIEKCSVMNPDPHGSHLILAVLDLDPYCIWAVPDLGA